MELLTGILVMMYLVVGYFAVRWAHRYGEPLPNLIIGVIGIIFWPLVILVFSFAIKQKDFVELIFGEPEK